MTDVGALAMAQLMAAQVLPSNEGFAAVTNIAWLRTRPQLGIWLIRHGKVSCKEKTGRSELKQYQSLRNKEMEGIHEHHGFQFKLSG